MDQNPPEETLPTKSWPLLWDVLRPQLRAGTLQQGELRAAPHTLQDSQDKLAMDHSRDAELGWAN